MLLWGSNKNDGEFVLSEIIRAVSAYEYMDVSKGDMNNKWKSFLYVNGEAIKLLRFDHWALF